ncbi:MAG: hypothetical protein ABIH65_00770 [Nanoarchaeota archaeon]
MGKLKVSGISSEEYPGGRLDIFKIPLSEKLVYGMENLFKDLGFSEDVINDLDIHYPSARGYYFFYNSRIKAHMFFEKNVLNLIFDSMISKKEIFEFFEKYFQFP